MTTLDIEAMLTSVRETVHIIERHQRTLMVNPSQYDEVKAAIDTLLAEPRFADMPKPIVIKTRNVKAGESMMFCDQCISQTLPFRASI